VAHQIGTEALTPPLSYYRPVLDSWKPGVGWPF